jgi:glyoxylate reductase
MSSARPKVYVTHRLADVVLAPLRREFDVTVFDGDGLVSRAELLRSLADIDGLLGRATIDAELLSAAPRLRVVSNIAVGYDNVDLDGATKRGVLITNTPGVLSDAVADLTLALILQLSRRLPEAVRFVREERWGRPGETLDFGVDLNGKTLSIVGMGRIGIVVAQRALAFGMRIVYFDTRGEVQTGLPAEYAASLTDALALADFVSLHTNLTPESRHLIGEAELARMKSTAYLINTARGSIVDQPALCRALAEGQIAGAALDVLEEEPPAPDDPILGLPNVIILPHIGSATRETRTAMAELAVSNLIACLKGEPCPNVVNPDAIRD